MDCIVRLLFDQLEEADRQVQGSFTRQDRFLLSWLTR